MTDGVNMTSAGDSHSGTPRFGNVPVNLLIALLLVMVIGGGCIWYVQVRRMNAEIHALRAEANRAREAAREAAEQERAAAQAEREKAATTTAFLQDVLANPTGADAYRQNRILDSLTQAEAELDQTLENPARDEAQIRTLIGQAYLSQSAFAKAESNLLRAYSLLESEKADKAVKQITAARIAELYERWNAVEPDAARAERAAAWRAKSE